MTLLRQSGVQDAAADRARRIPGEEGIWVFVLGDMTVFALFFATFMYSRGKNPPVFARDHAALHVALGTINTVLLLSSSLLVVLAVQRVLGGRRAGAWQLIAAALCWAQPPPKQYSVWLLNKPVSRKSLPRSHQRPEARRLIWRLLAASNFITSTGAVGVRC